MNEFVNNNNSYRSATACCALVQFAYTKPSIAKFNRDHFIIIIFFINKKRKMKTEKNVKSTKQTIETRNALKYE